MTESTFVIAEGTMSLISDEVTPEYTYFLQVDSLDLMAELPGAPKSRRTKSTIPTEGIVGRIDAVKTAVQDADNRMEKVPPPVWTWLQNDGNGVRGRVAVADAGARRSVFHAGTGGIKAQVSVHDAGTDTVAPLAKVRALAHGGDDAFTKDQLKARLLQAGLPADYLVQEGDKPCPKCKGHGSITLQYGARSGEIVQCFACRPVRNEHGEAVTGSGVQGPRDRQRHAKRVLGEEFFTAVGQPK